MHMLRHRKFKIENSEEIKIFEDEYKFIQIGQQCELTKIRGSKDKTYMRTLIEKNRRIT